MATPHSILNLEGQFLVIHLFKAVIRRGGGSGGIAGSGAIGSVVLAGGEEFHILSVDFQGEAGTASILCLIGVDRNRTNHRHLAAFCQVLLAIFTQLPQADTRKKSASGWSVLCDERRRFTATVKEHTLTPEGVVPTRDRG